MINRRRFLGCTFGGAALAVVGGGRARGAWAQSAQPGDSPYGALATAPDGNGLLLPDGFTSRIVARSAQLVAGTSHLWHIFPDGGATFPTDDGGWIYVSNSENPPPIDTPIGPLPLGGVGAIRFDSAGGIVDAYPVLSGSACNCAGGTTPWATWLSCEEWEIEPVPGVDLLPYDAGLVWECDPFAGTGTPRPALGKFKHEMVAVDPVGKRVYLTEDQDNGLFYRFTPDEWANLAAGVLEAAAVDAVTGSVTWLPVPDGAAPTAPLRTTVVGATPFNGGEGCVFDSGKVYVTTKGDHKVWVHDVDAGTMTVLYDGVATAGPLTGVDNIIASPLSHDLYVAEDGGNMEVCIITPEGAVAPVVRMEGLEHGVDLGIPGLPTVSEVTGLAFNPDGTRLYMNSERGGAFGILYEVTGPFRGSPLAAPPAAPPAPSPTSNPAPVVQPMLPPTGIEDAGWVGAGALAAGAALWRLRTRGD